MFLLQSPQLLGSMLLPSLELGYIAFQIFGHILGPDHLIPNGCIIGLLGHCLISYLSTVISKRGSKHHHLRKTKLIRTLKLQKYEHNLEISNYLTEGVEEPCDFHVKVQFVYCLLIGRQDEPFQELFHLSWILHGGGFKPYDISGLTKVPSPGATEVGTSLVSA